MSIGITESWREAAMGPNMSKEDGDSLTRLIVHAMKTGCEISIASNGDRYWETDVYIYKGKKRECLTVDLTYSGRFGAAFGEYLTNEACRIMDKLVLLDAMKEIDIL